MVKVVSDDVDLDLTACQALASSGIDPNAIELTRPESPMAPISPRAASVYGGQERAFPGMEPDALSDIESGAIRRSPLARSESSYRGLFDSGKSPIRHIPPYEAIFSDEIEPSGGMLCIPVEEMPPYGATVHGTSTKKKKGKKGNPGAWGA